MTKKLIACYSRAGSNYFGNRIVDLAVGNTRVVAEKIQALAGGDLFHIEPVKPYPADYDETVERAKEELGRNARPELKEIVRNPDVYDIVFLGYPIWWGGDADACPDISGVCGFFGKNDCSVLYA